MSLVASLFILSQTVALYTTDVGSLWIVSSLLGLAYGGLFGLAPVVCLEWFGLVRRPSILSLRLREGRG